MICRDFPGGVAELKNIARHAFDGEIFVDGADECLARLEHHAIICIIGNGAAGRQREQTRTAPAANAVIHGIVMDQCRAMAAFGAESLRQHADDFIEFFAREIPIWIAPSARVANNSFSVQSSRADGGDNLLREDVQRFLGNFEPIQFAVADALKRGHAFHQFIARERKQSALGQAAARCSGAAHALEQGGNGTSRAELANEIDRTDIDAQFERGRGDERLEFAALEAIFRIEPQLRGKAAVMGRDLVGADAARKDWRSRARPCGGC